MITIPATFVRFTPLRHQPFLVVFGHDKNGSGYSIRPIPQSCRSAFPVSGVHLTVSGASETNPHYDTSRGNERDGSKM